MTNGFQESFFYITKPYPFHGISITCNPRINVITKGNLIIYYYLESEDMKDLPESIATTSDTTYKFVDTANMQALKITFGKNYLAKFDEKELFLDKISYGLSRDRQTPISKEQQQVDLWVSNSDTIQLLNWLTSVNTEKQVYAVQGFHTLHLKGYKINEKIKQLIKNFMIKKGTMNTWTPCNGGKSEISDVVKNFKF